MNYKIDMQVLRIYSKQERIAMTEISSLLGMSGNTISRYVTGSRNPDLNTLLHICNTLRISVATFIHHSDLVPSHIEVYPSDQFKPITFRYEKIEDFRTENQLTRMKLLQDIRRHSDLSIDPSTYSRLTEKKRVGLDLPIGFMNTYNLPLTYLFDDPQMNPTEHAESSQTFISNSYLNDLKERVKQLEEENHRLLAENRRLKLYGQQPAQSGISAEVQRTMKRLINKVSRTLSEMEGCFEQPFDTEDTDSK